MEFFNWSDVEPPNEVVPYVESIYNIVNTEYVSSNYLPHPTIQPSMSVPGYELDDDVGIHAIWMFSVNVTSWDNFKMAISFNVFISS